MNVCGVSNIVSMSWGYKLVTSYQQMKELLIYNWHPSRLFAKERSLFLSALSKCSVAFLNHSWQFTSVPVVDVVRGDRQTTVGSGARVYASVGKILRVDSLRDRLTGWRDKAIDSEEFVGPTIGPSTNGARRGCVLQCRQIGKGVLRVGSAIPVVIHSGGAVASIATRPIVVKENDAGAGIAEGSECGPFGSRIGVLVHHVGHAGDLGQDVEDSRERDLLVGVIIDFHVNDNDFAGIVVQKGDNFGKDFDGISLSQLAKSVAENIGTSAVAHVH